MRVARTKIEFDYYYHLLMDGAWLWLVIHAVSFNDTIKVSFFFSFQNPGGGIIDIHSYPSHWLISV